MANPNEKKIASLREAWEKAIEKDKPKDALAALEGLEPLEPTEPRWPHRLGDLLRRLGRAKDAEAAYGRAMEIYNRQGFIARAVAVAKIIVQINPSRSAILDKLDQDAARSLRRASSSQFKRPNLPPPMAAPPPAPAPPPMPSIAPPSAQPVASERPSYIAGMPAAQVRAVATAMHLDPAGDVAKDEVRFSDVPHALSMDIEIEIADYEEVSGAYELGDEDLEIVEEPSAERLSLMSATTLFAEVPPEVLGDLARASELVDLPDGTQVFRRGQPADALFVIVEGTVHIEVPGIEGGGLDLAEGQVFGEGCLLEEGLRQADARVAGRLVALRIPKASLDAIVALHEAVGNILFDLLLQRLVTNTLQISPLFAAFDPDARRELAHLFEVRRAVRGTLVTEFGKRSDGLYLALAGDLEIEDAHGTRRMQLGAMFGQESLLSQAPARRTVRVLREAVLLRLPAARFGTFAMQYPPALAHLSELASHGMET